jgi:hypothetical protein
MLCGYCFCGCETLSTVTFETDSKLSRIEQYAFWHCSSLSSICIPSSVEMICQSCFEGCSNLSTVTFETDSKLSGIAQSAFRNCSSLSAIWIPSALQTILHEYERIVAVFP